MSYLSRIAWGLAAMTQGARSIFAEPLPPRPEASTPERMAWIRSRIRLYTRDLALEHLLTHPADHWLQVESFGAAIGFGLRCNAPHDAIIEAANAEWRDARLYAHNFLECLRRKLWHMCRARAPADAVVRTADDCMFEWAVFIPDELLMPLLRKIDNAARPRRRRYA